MVLTVLMMEMFFVEASLWGGHQSRPAIYYGGPRPTGIFLKLRGSRVKLAVSCLFQEGSILQTTTADLQVRGKTVNLSQAIRDCSL